MKTIVPFVVAVTASVLFAAVTSAEERVIELTDGSRIRGEIVSMENGSYTIRTGSLGTIKLSSSQIKGITSASQPPATPSDGSSAQGSAIESLQSRIVNNTELMRRILALQNDPRMQAVLSDPELMQAVQRFDLETLSSSPKIKALMNDPTVKEIQDDVQ